MTDLSIALLGTVQIALDERPVGFRTRKAEGLLLYLAAENALHPGVVIRRDTFLTLLWPDYPERSARQSLRTNLAYLRKAIPPLAVGDGDNQPLLLSDNQSIRLNPAVSYELDLDAFLVLLGQVERHEHEALATCVTCPAWLQEATALYRSDFLAGFYMSDSEPFEDWAGARRGELRRQALDALERLTTLHLGREAFGEAERTARRQLELDNLRESAHRQLMESLARRGRRRAALSHYDTLSEILQDELGVGPSAETEALAERIRQGATERVEPIPEPRSGAISTWAEPGLPAELTSFVGREREIKAIKELLESARLVTLTGPGGIGKTRLSLQVARSMAERYLEGVHFVSLTSVSEPRLVPNAIAQVLGVVERPKHPLSASLQRYLRDKRMLLVLDSFEHVLAAASLVTDLLKAAAGLRVLATSREQLRLAGEFEFPVPPLSVPEPGDAGPATDAHPSEAVALFVQRAAAVSPGFSLTEDNASAISTICRRLDGLPLAIELAAARVKLFRPQQLLARLESRLPLLTGGLRDAPARQRTLRATIDWSYDLLDQAERQLFARLSVFNGGRTLEAVEAVCGAGLPIDALNGLASLLDKSLLFQIEGPGGDPRFVMLETIHEYARERLVESGEARSLQRRHLAHFVSWVEAARPGYLRHGQILLMDQTEAEMDNLRAAFAWAAENDRWDAAARIAGSLHYFLHYKDHFVEGYEWVRRILARLESIPSRVKVPFLFTAGVMAYSNGDIAQSRTFYQQSGIVAQELGDQKGVAWSLTGITLSFLDPHNLAENEKGVRLCEEAIALHRELENKAGVAQTLNDLGLLWQAAGEFERAKSAFEEGIDVCRETGEILREALISGNLAVVSYNMGEYDRARDLAVFCLRQMSQIGAKRQTIYGLSALAGPTGKLGAPENAARLLGASEKLLAEIEADYEIGVVDEFAGATADIKAQLSKAAFAAAWAEGQEMTLEQAVAFALDASE